METGESSTHLYVSRTSTVDSTTSTNTNSSFDDGQQENDHEVKGERSLPQQRTEHFEGSNGPGEARRPSIGLRETRIIISQDDGVTIDNGGEEEEEEDEDEEARKRAESLHKLHQQHALDSWDQEGDSASSSSRSSSNTRISPRLSPSPSHRAHRQVRHTRSNTSSSVPPNINSSISLMCLGSSVMKVKRQGRTSSKMLYLDSTRSYIRWKPSKKGHKAIVNIKNVREIREGACTDTFKKHLASTAGHKPSHCFSIIHGTSWESLDIVAGSLDEAQAWIRGLRHLMEQAQEETAQSDQLRDSWLKSVFESADKSGDGLLSMDEVLKLLHKLNVNLSKRKVKQLFREADTNIDEHLGKLDFDEFVHFYKTLSMRPELYALLREYSCGKEHMTLEDLDVFLRNEQDINKQDEQACRGLIEKYEPVPENVCNGRLGIDGLMRYLLSEEGDLFNSGHRGVNQDMTQPLSHYYIASSHNTYLLGDQLMSQSSVDVYGLVLQAGCRCVELDTWDGKEGEPVIYHGYTLTSKIKFRDVITVVNKYAFVSSPYPVILSIENHCTLEQQKKMARYLLEILGDQLIISSPTDGGPGGLPSPDSLKYKILIKAKKLPLDHDADLEAGEVSEEDSADELDDDFKLEKTETRSKFESIAMAQLALMRKKPISPSQQAWQRIAHKRLERLRALLEATELKEKNTENKASKNGRTGLTGTFRKLKATRRRAKLQHSSESDNNSSMEFDRSSSRDDDLEGGTNENQQVEQRKQRLSSTNRKRAFVLSRQLSDLVKYTRSVAFKGFPENMPCWELPSLGEMRANNLAATRAADFANFTTHNLCRVYPSAYRIDSSNFNPQTLWNCGCQLVALNYQTEGRAMQLLRAKFRANGNCGYLLKPSILRQDKVHFDPTSNNPIPGVQKKQLTIHIISGQQLPKPPQSLLGERGEIIDPYVEVEVIGLNGDCTKAQTKTVQDNGFNPVWDYVVTFPITLPELTLIRFVVWDEDPIGRDFIGQATFPFISLCQGYRHIHLEGLDHATIFVHVTIEDFTDKKYIKNSKGLRSTSITRTTSSPSRNRTKSIDAEVNLLTGGSPAHQASPKRRTSLAERLGIRRRHSTTALLVEGIMTGSGGSGGIKSPTSPTSTPTFGLLRQKRRSYEGEMRKGRSQGDEEGCDDVFGDDDCDLIPVDCDAILDRIMASEVAVELEADGSVSVPLNEIVHILRLGISPSQIIQVIQDCRLSLRPALHDVPPISAPGNSWDVAAGEDVDSGPMDTREGLGSGVLSQFKHYDPEPAPTLSRVLDDDDLVFPTNNNDISTEMEALLSARFTKERLAFGMVSYDEFSSTEDCSSLGSAEDFMTDNLATDHVINNSTGDLVPGENGLISKEGHVKVEQETGRQQTVAGLPEVANSSEGKVQGRSINEPEGVLDYSCKNENQGSDYDNQGDSLCDVVVQDENVVHVCRSVVVASEPDESLHKSNLDDQPSRDNEATSGIASPCKFSSCIRNSNAYSDISHSTTEDVHNVNSIDQSQGQMQYSDPEEREGYDQGQVYMQHLSESDAERHPQVQSKYSVEGHVQGQAEEELGLLSQCHTQNSEQSESGEQLGSLSNVVDSMFDLVASLAEEERELQTLEERNLVREGWNANINPTNKEGNLDSDSTEDLPPTDCTLVSPDCCEDSTMQAQRPSSPQYTGNRQFHVYSSQQSRYFEDPLNDTDFIDASYNHPESSDSLDAHGQSRPLAPTGLSPDTPPLKNVNLTSQKNGDLADDNVLTAPEKVTPNGSASCRGPRKKSLVKVLSGLLQKYELFDAKQSESFSKGIRSSLRKRFMTRSVPDISKMIFKEEGENVVKESNGYLQSVPKKVWSSSNQDIRTTGPVSKSFENLCDIVEESQTSKMALRFSSSYTDIATTKNGGFPYRPDLSDDSAHKFNPDKELDTDDCIHATQEDVDGSDISKVVVITEDKAVQTDSVPPKYLPKASQVNRLIPGSWNRDGQPTRPLSCPVLPQETGNESNKHRIVYFHEQPLKKLQNSSSGKQKKFTEGEGPKEDVQQCSENDQLDLEDIRVTLADVSSEDPDSADDEGELSSHICIVQGCNCGNSNLSNLLDSSLLVETCFTGDDDERAKKVEQQAGVNFEKGSDDYVRKYKEERDATESNAADDIPTLDCLTSGIDKPVAALKSIHDDNDKESRISIGMGHSISSIHTHLGGLRRSIGTFRSEYNRSFDDGDNTDEEENTLTCSPQKTVLPETCTNEQTSSDLKQESILCAPDLKPIHEIEILDDSFSSESIPSTNSNDGTSASENIDTDPELLENPVSDRDADTSTEEEGLDAQERNVTPTNDVHDQFSLLKDTNEESKTGQENNAQVNIQEARPKSVSSESSYDMFKSLEELSTVLDDELLHGRKHGRSSSSVSCAFHSIQPVKALEPIRDDVRSATLTSSEVGNGESTCTRTGQSELDCPSAICNSKVLAKPDKLPAGSSSTSEEGLSTSKETAHERPPLPARPVIGSAISVRFLGQIPRQMSAYSYSDSDSDYDSTTSGSSQETIVEVIPTHPKFARQMVKPPVPPKSPRLKAQLVKQGSKEKPPVPPKPQHIKALAAEKRAKALQKSISLATSPDITFPEIPPKTVVTEDSSGFKIKDRITGMESKTGALNRNGHNEMLSSGMLSPGLVHSLSSIPSNESITPRDPHHSPPNKHSPSLHEHLESMYNVTIRKKFRAKPPLEQRHSTGSLFSLTDLPSIRDKAGKFPSADQEAIPDKEFLDKLDQSVESWSLDRKRQSSQRVYFMLNV